MYHSIWILYSNLYALACSTLDTYLLGKGLGEKLPDMSAFGYSSK